MTRRRFDRARRLSRKQRLDMAGAAIFAAVLIGFCGVLNLCAQLDAANGITVAQSLHNWGF